MLSTKTYTYTQWCITFRDINVPNVRVGRDNDSHYMKERISEIYRGLNILKGPELGIFDTENILLLENH